MNQIKSIGPHVRQAPLARLQTEQQIIGMALITPNLIIDVPDGFGPPTFFEPAHQHIYFQILELEKAGEFSIEAIDLKLDANAAYQALGGYQYLGDMIDMAPPPMAFPSTVKTLIGFWKKSELIKTLEVALAEAKEGDAPDDVQTSLENNLGAIRGLSAGVGLTSAADAFDSVERQYFNPELAFGIKLGLGPLDDVSGGFMPGELWLGAGRPGMGKSAVASSAALHIARFGRSPDGLPIGIVEIGSEMTVEQMTRRHIADWLFEKYGERAPSYSAMRKRTMTAEQQAMVLGVKAEFRALENLKMVYSSGLTVSKIRHLCRRQKIIWGRQGIKLGMIIVDHVGLIKASGSTRGRTEAQGEVARELKELAGPTDLDCAIFALVQLNRQVEARDDKRPTLPDLRDSGEWEENADGAIGFYRDAYYASREPKPKNHDAQLLLDERKASKLVDAILMKIREGQMETVKLWADMARNAIRGYAPDNFYDDVFL